LIDMTKQSKWRGESGSSRTRREMRCGLPRHRKFWVNCSTLWGAGTKLSPSSRSTRLEQASASNAMHTPRRPSLSSTAETPRHTAGAVLERAEAAARDTTVPHGQAVALHCRGLVERDADTLVRAAKEYAAAGRPLPEAQALEAAAVALAEARDAAGAREHFTE